MTDKGAIDYKDMQGLIVRGYGQLPHACYLLFRVVAADPARMTLKSLTEELAYSHEKPEQWAMNLALTSAGLEALAVPPAIIAEFSDAFRAGMTTTHKRRILGDEGDSAPEKWAWGGPNTSEVHGVFMAFADSEQTLETRLDTLESQLEAGGMDVVERLSTQPQSEAREHFGFRDAIGQPYIAEFDRLNRRTTTPVALGEFVLGYKNGYERYTQRPRVSPELDPEDLLVDDPESTGLKDLGFNGSYLVFRQLSQDVHEFWRTMKAKAQPNGAGNHKAAIKLAAKMVGRWPSGSPLVLAPDQDRPDISEPDEFVYHDLDAQGHACPLGAHIRRTHPRDSLDPRPGSDASIAFSDRHRLLRRGRIFGRPFHEDFTAEAFLNHLEATDNGEERGLHFVCLGANIQRQFEFVQHTWANNPTFNGLNDDPDPLIGPRIAHGKTRDSFTEQAEPVRCRYQGLPEFVRTRGGAYFFLPSRSALRFLTSPMP